MNLWTFFCIIVIIGVTGDALKKIFQGGRSGKGNAAERQKIEDLTLRINALENSTDIRELKKRLQALESIVVDGDYILDMKFKKAFGKHDESSRHQSTDYL